jgi:hypothetical protein
LARYASRSRPSQQGAAGPRGRGGVQRVRDAPREFLETRDEVQVAAQSGAIEPLIDLRDLTAQVG